MQENPTYRSLFAEVIAFLENRISYALEHGIDFSQIVVDPGIGFGKTAEHNLRLIKHIHLLHTLERPILLGASRKRFIGAVLNVEPKERETGTAVVNTVGIFNGVHIIRVHDVAYQVQAAKMADALLNESIQSM